MPDTTMTAAPNVFALPVASLRQPGQETPRPGFTVLDELIRRLPGHVSATPRQMPYAGASLSVLLSLGSILEVHTSGFNTFQISTALPDMGIAEHGARAQVYRRSPPMHLAPRGTLDELVNVARAGREALKKYGTHLPDVKAYYVMAKAERACREAFAVYEAGFARVRAKVIDRLPEIRAWMAASVPRAAAESHEALVVTSGYAGDREAYVAQIVARAEQAFPTPARLETEVRMSLRDTYPPEMHPAPEMVEEVLGLKRLVEAEVRAAQARAQGAEAEAAFQAEMFEMRRQAEEEEIRRQIAERDRRFQERLEVEVSGAAAVFERCRAMVYEMAESALGLLNASGALPGPAVKSLRGLTAVYQALSPGMATDDKVAQLQALLAEPARNRSAGELKRVLTELEEMTAVTAARLANQQDALAEMAGRLVTE